MSIKSMMPSNHPLLCRPLLLQSSIFPSIKVFSNESVLRIRWANCCSFSFSISPSNEHPGLISFRMDWLDLLAVQGTLSSLLQHHRSAAIIPVSLPSPRPPPSRSSPEAGLPELHSSFPPALRLTPDRVCVLMLLSPCIPPCKATPYICVSIPFLQTGSSVSFFTFHVYALLNKEDFTKSWNTAVPGVRSLVFNLLFTRCRASHLATIFPFILLKNKVKMSRKLIKKHMDIHTINKINVFYFHKINVK